MGYKILGFTVWHGALWFLRRKYGKLIPSRNVAAAGMVGVAVAALALNAARKDSGSRCERA